VQLGVSIVTTVPASSSQVQFSIVDWYSEQGIVFTRFCTLAGVEHARASPTIKTIIEIFIFGNVF
jgi:hypothetical protein